jgi:gas vesicle protein
LTQRRITVTKLLKSILKTAVYILDQADNAASDMRDRVADQVDRVSDQVSDITDRGRRAIYGEDHTLRNVLTFAAGVGVGLGAGMLLAPASGEDTRSSMRDKVQDIGDRVRQRFSTSGESRPTGTESL